MREETNITHQILDWMEDNQHVEDYLDMIRMNAEDALNSDVQSGAFESLDEFKKFIGIEED